MFIEKAFKAFFQSGGNHPFSNAVEGQELKSGHRIKGKTCKRSIKIIKNQSCYG